MSTQSGSELYCAPHTFRRKPCSTDTYLDDFGVNQEFQVLFLTGSLFEGVGFGLLVFAGFFVVYFVTHIAGGLRQNAAIGLSAITGSTIYRPLFWVALLLTLSASCAWTKLLAR
jgi:hypothetical protein